MCTDAMQIENLVAFYVKNISLMSFCFCSFIDNTLLGDPQCNNQGPANPGKQDGPKFGISK